MDYFFATASIKSREVGVFPQSQTAYDFADIQEKRFDLEEKIELDFTLPRPIIDKKAKLTSMLSVVVVPSWFLVLDTKLVETISRSKLSLFQTWNLECQHLATGERIKNYVLFYICKPSDQDVVNYESSSFYIGKNGDWRFRGDLVKVKDQNEYIEKNNAILNFGYLKCNELVVNFANTSSDLIRLSYNPLLNGYLISARLKSIIEMSGFDGIEFQKVESIDSRIKVIG